MRCLAGFHASGVRAPPPKAWKARSHSACGIGVCSCTSLRGEVAIPPYPPNVNVVCRHARVSVYVCVCARAYARSQSACTRSCTLKVNVDRLGGYE